MIETVKIGPTAGRINEITKESVSFVNEAGERRRVQLIALYPREFSEYIGTRELDKAPWTVKLSGKKGVTFVFESYEAAYELLLNPLGELNRFTIDLT